MRVGIAADHGAFALKGQLEESLRKAGYEVVDFSTHQLNPAEVRTPWRCLCTTITGSECMHTGGFFG